VLTDALSANRLRLHLPGTPLPHLCPGL